MNEWLILYIGEWLRCENGLMNLSIIILDIDFIIILIILKIILHCDGKDHTARDGKDHTRFWKEVDDNDDNDDNDDDDDDDDDDDVDVDVDVDVDDEKYHEIQ